MTYPGYSWQKQLYMCRAYDTAWRSVPHMQSYVQKDMDAAHDTQPVCDVAYSEVRVQQRAFMSRFQTTYLKSAELVCLLLHPIRGWPCAKALVRSFTSSCPESWVFFLNRKLHPEKWRRSPSIQRMNGAKGNTHHIAAAFWCISDNTEPRAIPKHHCI